MMALLFLALAFAPFVALGTAGMLAVRAWRRELGAGWRLPDTKSLCLLTVMAGATALCAYAYGVSRGFYILDPDQMCAARGVQGDHVVTRATLPVSAQCVTSDGVGTELVPVWVNPVVFVGLTFFVLAVVTGILAMVRRRRPAG